MAIDQTGLVTAAHARKPIITEFAAHEVGNIGIEIAAKHDPRTQNTGSGTLGKVRTNQIDMWHLPEQIILRSSLLPYGWFDKTRYPKKRGFGR